MTVGQAIELDTQAAHYLRTVLRLKKQQQLIVFNGQGNEYRAKVSLVSRKSVVIQVLSKQIKDIESPLTIHLGLGISRSERMDWAIQKSVELGVGRITPLLTERCVVKLTDEKRQLRLRHWQAIIQHAAEQSGRTRLPLLQPIQPLTDWVSEQTALCFFLDPCADKSLAAHTPEQRQITLLSGPEGGFTDQERAYATETGFIPVRLGPRILRTETAALAAISAIQTLWGDFS